MENFEESGVGAVAQTGGQKVAGWVLRVFGVLVSLCGGLYFSGLMVAGMSATGNMRWSEWGMFLGVLLGSALVTGVGGVMRGMGSLLIGLVRFEDRRALVRWMAVGCARDGLIVSGGFWLLGAVWLMRSISPSWLWWVILVMGLGGLWGGERLTRVMKRMAGRTRVAGPKAQVGA